jgi:hypothetical protein
VVRASLTNREAISFALDQLLAAPPAGIRIRQISRSDLHGLGPRADVFMDQTREALTIGRESDIEQIVARAIQESGVDAISTRPGAGRGPDLAIWSDSLQPFVGNPLLIEIKANIRSRNDARKALDYFSALVSSLAARWGLFLYGQGPGLQDGGVPAPPNVLVLSLASFFEEMKNQPFIDVVRQLQNRRVHGESP